MEVRNNVSNEQLLIAASKLKDAKVCVPSQTIYKGKLNTMKGFFLEDPSRSQYIDSTNNNAIRVPLPENIVLMLFGWLATNVKLARKKRKTNNNTPITINEDNVDDDDQNEREDAEINVENNNATTTTNIVDLLQSTANKETVSSTTMGGYKSALVWWYGQNNVVMDRALDNKLNDIVKGISIYLK